MECAAALTNEEGGEEAQVCRNLYDLPGGVARFTFGPAKHALDRDRAPTYGDRPDK